MIRKLASILVMILGAAGCLLCLAILIGAWVINEPATVAVTGALEMVEGYLNLAGETTGQLESNLEMVQGRRGDAYRNADPKHCHHLAQRHCHSQRDS
jgi:hypothetical protein